MNWQRRRLLQLVGATGVSTLAGCGSTKSDPKTDSQPEFGSSVAVSGDGTTAPVGAPREAGSAYVFAANGGGWIQQAKLTAADGDDDDYFGYSVAVSGDGTSTIVGTPYDEDPNGEEAGSAYVFADSGSGWSQQAKLIADDGDTDDQFGYSVAVSGDGTTGILGTLADEDPNGKEAGSAYVFAARGDDWGQQAKLTAADGDHDDVFGSSVAVSGDGTTALIGAFRDEDPNGYSAGSAYVFEASGSDWAQQAKPTAEDGDTDDQFGYSVAVSGDGTTALIGAPHDEAAGSVYVFAATGGGWTQQAKLTTDNSS